MEIEIIDVKELSRFTTPTTQVKTLSIKYKTDSGYEGEVVGIPSQSTRDEILESIKKDAEVKASLKGTKLEV